MEALAAESIPPAAGSGHALDVVSAGADAPDREARKKDQFRREAIPHLEDLYGYALRLTGGEEADAEDLVQVAMLRAFRAWDTYELGTNCGAWLRTILRNCFVNRFRRDSRRPESAAYEDLEGVSSYDGDSDLPDAEGPFERPDAAFFDEMIDGEVVEAVEGLRDEFRVTLVLVDLDGQSYEEVAEALGIPVGTVKSRLYRARRRLREELTDYARDMGYVR